MTTPTSGVAPGPAAWRAVEEWFDGRLLAPDDVLEAALRRSEAAGLPAIAVSASQGALLQLLALTLGARRILEVGTLGGYSTIWLARALPADGHLVTCELDPDHAAVATANLAAAGLGDRVEVVVGPAATTLQRLVDNGVEPFDLVFIDADKPSNPAYLSLALRLTRPGSLIVVDNVVRRGEVLAAEPDDAALGVRRAVELVAAEPRLAATVVQTVGGKGWDGFLIARVAG
jgi:caffeoyl-CoA O-methyltransferase